MTAERRKLERKYLVIYSRVFDRRSGQVIGYLGDLTPDGAMVIGDNRIEPGTVLNLRFDLPDMLDLKQDHLDIKARSVWCKPDVDPAFVNVGFQFQEPDAEDLKIVDMLIDLYEFRRQTNHYPPTFTELEDNS
jgi:hypothetical protein